MHVLPVFEKAEAYLSVHLSHSGPGGVVKAPGPFVTLSRESGAGGTAVARAVVDKLNRDAGENRWSIYSANLIEEMLSSAGLSARLARFLPEDRTAEVESTIGEILGLHPNLWNLIDKTNGLIRQLARDGYAIFLGRGATFATAGVPNGVHVRLVAPAGVRADRTARFLDADTDTGRAYNSRRDAARARYVRATFNCDIADSSEYDLVLNTATVPVATTAEIVAGFVRAHATVVSATQTAATANEVGAQPSS